MIPAYIIIVQEFFSYKISDETLLFKKLIRPDSKLRPFITIFRKQFLNSFNAVTFEVHIFYTMRSLIVFAIISSLVISCRVNTQQAQSMQAVLPVAGTWKLISGTLIEKGDTTVTDYTKDVSFIKVINDTHFAFLKHNTTKGKDSTNGYDSGGGPYTLKDSSYTEHLEYCNEKEWEGHDFTFTITIKNDTLTQSGIEKVDDAGVNRLNIEKYFRLKN